jgi:GT2 family glycosyltransferase
MPTSPPWRVGLRSDAWRERPSRDGRGPELEGDLAMSANPRVAVVVPVHNGLTRTARFLDSFRQVDYPHYTIVVVDDGSTDGTASTLAARFPRVVRLAGGGNLWWAGATNRGVRWALDHGYDYVLTINNDTQVSPGFLGLLVDAARNRPRTIVGSRIDILGRPGVVWALGSEMAWEKGEIFHLLQRGETRLVDGPELLCTEALTGCGTLVPAACYREVGYYDAVHFPQYHADVEFVLRAARKGWQVLVQTRAVVFNDVTNSTADRVRTWAALVLSRRSAVYWRPLLAIHLRFCPHRLRARSAWQYYGWYFWRNDQRVQKFGWLLRPLREWWRRLETRLRPVSPATGESCAPSVSPADGAAAAGRRTHERAA